MVKYIVVTRASLHELVDSINGCIDNGRECQGGISIYLDNNGIEWFSQAMIENQGGASELMKKNTINKSLLNMTLKEFHKCHVSMTGEYYFDTGKYNATLADLVRWHDNKE